MKKNRKILKTLANWRVGQARQKGAILIEFIIAIPIFFIIIWGVMNLMIYLMASSQLNEAAYESARSIAKELRGYEGTDIESQAQMDRIEKEISLIVRQNKFLLYGVPGHQPKIAYNRADCNKLYDGDANYDTRNKNIFCAYIQEYDNGSGKKQQKVVVNMRSEFQFIGSFIKNLDDYIQVNAESVAPKELQDRLNYVNY